MRDAVSRGSGSIATIATIGSLVAVTLGLLAGVTVIRNSTESLRAAEAAAVKLATLYAEGDVKPCEQSQPPVTSCTLQPPAVTVVVELRGIRAGATAGPR